MIFAIVCWSFGFAAMGVALAATLSAGDLIKASGAAVYYYGDDGKRYVFPTESTYMSWYGDFSAVKIITDAELAAIAIGGNATVRPGTKLVKINTDPKTYAVSTGGVLRHVDSESRAITLYGANWNQRIIDIPESFWVNYSTGDAVSSDVHPDGALVKYDGVSTVYLIEGGLKRAITGDGFTANRFKDADIVTIATSVSYSDGAGVTEKEDSANVDGGAAAPVTTGTGLTVALASDTPASATVVDNSFTEFAKYSFTASSDGAVTIQSVKVTRFGVGAPASITRVYLYDGVKRLTSGSNISSTDNTAEFNSVNLEVSAGATKVLSLWVDGADEKSDSHGFKLAVASDVATDGAAVNGSFPVSGNIMTYSNLGTSPLIVMNNGTAASNPDLGKQGATVLNLTLQAQTEDAIVERFRLKQTGTTDMVALSNFELYYASTKVADGTKDGKFIDFVFTDPYTIDEGKTKTFSVKVDIGATPTPGTDTIKFLLYKDVDLYAVGGTYGFGMPVTNSLTEATTETTIQGGDVTFADNGPVAGEIKDGGQDVVLLNFAITSAIDVLITDIDGIVQAQTAELTQLDDIRLIDADTGATIMGPYNATLGADLSEKIDFSVTRTQNIDHAEGN